MKQMQKFQSCQVLVLFLSIHASFKTRFCQNRARLEGDRLLSVVCKKIDVGERPRFEHLAPICSIGELEFKRRRNAEVERSNAVRKAWGIAISTVCIVCVVVVIIIMACDQCGCSLPGRTPHAGLASVEEGGKDGGGGGNSWGRCPSYREIDRCGAPGRT